MAFAHGSNDVANAIGPMSAIISVISEGAIGAKSAVSSSYVLFNIYRYSVWTSDAWWSRYQNC